MLSAFHLADMLSEPMVVVSRASLPTAPRLTPAASPAVGRSATWRRQGTDTAVRYAPAAVALPSPGQCACMPDLRDLCPARHGEDLLSSAAGRRRYPLIGGPGLMLPTRRCDIAPAAVARASPDMTGTRACLRYVPCPRLDTARACNPRPRAVGEVPRAWVVVRCVAGPTRRSACVSGRGPAAQREPCIVCVECVCVCVCGVMFVG